MKKAIIGEKETHKCSLERSKGGSAPVILFEEKSIIPGIDKLGKVPFVSVFERFLV